MSTDLFAPATSSLPTVEITPSVGSGILGVGGVLPPVLDVCCGPRGMWFNKRDPRAMFTDRRRETIEMSYPSGEYTEVIDPDVVADFTELPFHDGSFHLVVMDPPHIEQASASGRIVKRYGHLFADWRGMLEKGFAECFRVLRPNGTFIFKWNECRIPVAEILALTPEAPLFGHQSGKTMQTHWIAFLKGGRGAELVAKDLCDSPKSPNESIITQ